RVRVQRLKHEMGLSTEEAAAKAEEPGTLGRQLTILSCPPEQVTWEDLQSLVGQAGTRATDRWGEIKQAAVEELRCGHRAGAALLGGQAEATPWRLAQFLAVRAELAEGCQPRNGVERQLVDQMAVAQAALYDWMGRASQDGLGGDEAAAAAGAMADRFSKMFQ